MSLVGYILCDGCGATLDIEANKLTNSFFRRWWVPDQGWEELSPDEAAERYRYKDLRKLKHHCPTCKRKKRDARTDTGKAARDRKPDPPGR